MEYWLKSLGGGLRQKWLRDDWQNERDGLLLRCATFSVKPGIRPGDGIVYYAVGHRVIFAVGTATSLPFVDHDDETRWPFRVKVSLRYRLDFVHDGVPLDDIDVDRPKPLRVSIRQHGHIRLTPAEYEAATRALKARTRDA